MTALVDTLTAEAAALVDAIIPDCEGARLGTSAILARVLADHGVPTVAVRGTYDEHDHWWLETDTARIDATRWQFTPGAPLVEAFAEDDARDETPYVRERSVPSAWTHDQAVLEFARMFQHPGVGVDQGRRLLGDLTRRARAAGTS